MPANASPFDAVASSYDADFTDTAAGRVMRDTVWREIAPWVTRGSEVLDLGCGTGEDMAWMAQRGARVLGLDGSPAMVRQAESKLERLGLAAVAKSFCADLNNPGRFRRQGFGTAGFDLVLANFGVLNCLECPAGLIARVATELKTGGHAVFVVMGRLCLWEWLYFGARMKPSAALRRIRGRAVARLDHRHSTPVWYYGSRELAAMAASVLVPVETLAIGTIAPMFLTNNESSPASGGSAGMLHRLESRLSRIRLAATISDHYMMVFRKQ